MKIKVEVKELLKVIIRELLIKTTAFPLLLNNMLIQKNKRIFQYTLCLRL